MGVEFVGRLEVDTDGDCAQAIVDKLRRYGGGSLAMVGGFDGKAIWFWRFSSSFGLCRVVM